MTKFEKIGADLQSTASSKFEANKRFHYSCYMCNLRGINLDCDRCAINYAHDNALEVFDLMAKTNSERSKSITVKVEIR